MKIIKPYDQVKIGDIAMESPDASNNWDNKLGEIIWKGTLKELDQSEYWELLYDWGDDAEEIAESYDLVIVKTDGWDGGPVLFGYNEDPCSCVVFED